MGFFLKDLFSVWSNSDKNGSLANVLHIWFIGVFLHVLMWEYAIIYIFHFK